MILRMEIVCFVMYQARGSSYRIPVTWTFVFALFYGDELIQTAEYSADSITTKLMSLQGSIEAIEFRDVILISELKLITTKL